MIASPDDLLAWIKILTSCIMEVPLGNRIVGQHWLHITHNLADSEAGGDRAISCSPALGTPRKSPHVMAELVLVFRSSLLAAAQIITQRSRSPPESTIKLYPMSVAVLLTDVCGSTPEVNGWVFIYLRFCRLIRRTLFCDKLQRRMIES